MFELWKLKIIAIYLIVLAGVALVVVSCDRMLHPQDYAEPPQAELKAVPYSAKIDAEDVHTVPKQIIKIEENDLDSTRDRVYILPRGSKMMYLYRTHVLPSGIGVLDVSFARIEDRCDKSAPSFCSFDFVISEDPNYPSAIYITDLWVEDR